MIEQTDWIITEDDYGIYKQRINEFGFEEVITEYKQKYWDENPPQEPEPKPPTWEEQLAQKDKEIIELKKFQSVTSNIISEMNTTQQEMLELIMGMGNG